ncbi:MAG: ABC transporter permease [Coriobacteriales bacterium]|jgi:putative ABC transport system permease protein|nr:ABC transporter permease [Coriobacteriales bacterium]
MALRYLLSETWISLSANKVRSALTMLGIVVGVASVIAMTSLISGMEGVMMTELGLYQARMVQVHSTESMSLEDAEALEKAFPDYESVGSLMIVAADVSSASQSLSTQLFGVTENYAYIQNIELEQGRFLTESDRTSSSRVAVVGKGILRDLYGSENAQALGENLYIGPRAESYTIVGIIEGNGTSRNYNRILIPLDTLHVRLAGVRSIDTIFALAREGVDPVALSNRTQSYMTGPLAHQPDTVYVYSMQELMDELNLIVTGFSFMLSSIAIIALLVGGIGIMNMMLTSVAERRREIGLRKSLGAHASTITRQFLLESIILSLSGGVLGIILGLIIAVALGAMAQNIGLDMPLAPAVGIESILGVAGICVAIGIIFGFYPARRAARLDPVESLRYQ